MLLGCDMVLVKVEQAIAGHQLLGPSTRGSPSRRADNRRPLGVMP